MTNRLICLIISIMLLSGCTFVNQLRLRNANDHLEPVWQKDKTESFLETNYDGEKPYVYATINGVEGFKFLVDTGASITILQDTEKVKTLNLERGYDLAIAGWGDEQDSPAFQSELVSLELDNAKFEKVNVAFMPVTKTKYYLRPDEAVFDGVLGHDVIKHFNWTFDKKNNQIIINSASLPVPESAFTLPIDIFFSKLYIDSTIDLGKQQQLEHELIIDTGSRHYLKINSLYLKKNQYQLPEPSITAADFGVSGRALHQRITVPKLNLGGLTMNNVKTNIIKSDEDDDFWIVGSALLNQYISIIDYQTNQLHLIEYPDSEYRTRYNLLGLELRKIISGEFVVRFVFPDIVSDSIDIKEGDLITSIDGIPSKEISLEKWLTITGSGGEHHICRKRIEIVCSNLTAKQIDGYSRVSK